MISYETGKNLFN